ncbi:MULTISPECIES: RcpC/CpaB family pilus assembly protein [unclassified Streptomyces]|uniref:RcpC/CpaB family pilus assembly protein n=1 Tax=unclassified Streptomyces TaxID=2593676 RepID=UPI0009981DD0
MTSPYFPEPSARFSSPSARLPESSSRFPEPSARLPEPSAPLPDFSAHFPVPSGRFSRASCAAPGTDAPRRPDPQDTPPSCAVPHFAPVRVRGGAGRLRRLVRHRRRAVAAGLAVTAAALVAAGPHAEGRPRGHPDGVPRARAGATAGPVASPPHRGRPRAATVTAPVRIADAATVRLLRPGDRVDVIAADGGGAARVVASGARVTGVPEPPGAPGADGTRAGAGPVPAAEAGALIVLAVPRADAARLAGAGAAGRLAVTLW